METESRLKLKRNAAWIIRIKRKLSEYTILVQIKEQGLVDYST